MSLSNEAMYRKTWSSFVDGAISKHQRREIHGCAGGGDSVGASRFEVRDVVCLEEILAKLENAEGGWIDYERGPPKAELHGSEYLETGSTSLEPTSDSLLRRQDRYSRWGTLLSLTPNNAGATT